MKILHRVVVAVIVLVALLLQAGVSGQIRETFSGLVVGVADGATVSVRRAGETAVSYTHLTLPTILLVESWVVAGG